MKRTDLIHHVESHGCSFFREGAKHTIYRNDATGAMSAVPRHREIKNILARKICDDLGIPRP
jgi:predicted RNA binding protein YcfA (HicA-like mRNA interferase family)